MQMSLIEIPVDSYINVGDVVEVPHAQNHYFQRYKTLLHKKKVYPAKSVRAVKRYILQRRAKY